MEEYKRLLTEHPDALDAHEYGWHEGDPPPIPKKPEKPAGECVCADAVPATVLDPFAGSGTTGTVALRLGRSFKGIEINPEIRRTCLRRSSSSKGTLRCSTCQRKNVSHAVSGG